MSMQANFLSYLFTQHKVNSQYLGYHLLLLQPPVLVRQLGPLVLFSLWIAHGHFCEAAIGRRLEAVVLALVTNLQGLVEQAPRLANL